MSSFTFTVILSEAQNTISEPIMNEQLPIQLVTLSPQLCNLLKVHPNTQMSLIEVYKTFYNYLKDNDLRNHKIPQLINTNNELKELISDNHFYAWDIAKILKPHLSF
jgi:chromatin remodeling complex protein RSC6